MTVEEVKEAVNRYFSDTGRSKEDTLAGLQEIREEIEILMDSLQV